MWPLTDPPWKSPITADVVAAGEVGLEQARLDGVDVYWVERRSQEGGRKVIVHRSPDGRGTAMTPVGFNARTRVHEYGGGDYAVSDSTIVFSNFTDQRLYVQRTGFGAAPSHSSCKIMRYADGFIDRRRNLLFCVREDHTGHGEAINTLVSIDVQAENAGKIVVSGNEFYSSPRLSPDGSQLAWLTWNHPNMPWDGTELWLGKLTGDGSIDEAVQVAGGINESIFQPEWSPDGTLYFVSDRSGWWNIYRWRDDKAEPLLPNGCRVRPASVGFRLRALRIRIRKTDRCSYTKNGRDYLATLDTVTRALDDIELPFTAISQVHAAGDCVVFIGASSTEPTSIASLNLATRELEVLRRSRETVVDAGYLTNPRAIEFPTERGLTAYGHLYPPRNRDYAAPANAKPPLVVLSHGGPTACDLDGVKPEHPVLD